MGRAWYSVHRWISSRACISPKLSLCHSSNSLIEHHWSHRPSKHLFSTDCWRMSRFFRLELHILDDRMVRPVDLCNIHHYTKVFHDSLFCCDLWQCDDTAADVWNSSCFPRSLSRTDPWKEETLISRKSFRFVFVRVVISNKDGKISAATDWRVTARSLDEQARHFSERLVSKLAREERKRKKKAADS